MHNRAEHVAMPSVRYGAVSDGATIAAFAGRPDRMLIVTTPTVARLYGEETLAGLRDAEVRADLMILAGGEDNKSWPATERLLSEFQSRGLGRDDVVVSLGGGVLSDVAGFAASLHRRGIRRINLPTTLMGQIDAAIGVKTAVNFGGRRNAVGAFVPPTGVLIDVSVLSTLPALELRQGLAETVKVALALAPALLPELHALSNLDDAARVEAVAVSKTLVRTTVEATMSSLALDPHEVERGPRPLDLGHTFSPELEAATGFAIRHGDAVAIDMAFSAALAVVVGALDRAGLETLIALISRLGLPVRSDTVDAGLIQRALDRCKADRGGSAWWPVPAAGGTLCYLDGAGEGALREAQERLANARVPEACR